MRNTKEISSMKKNSLSIYAAMAMFAMTAVFSACSSDNEEQQTTRYSLVLDGLKYDYASIDNNGTRAISVSGDVLKTFWKSTDLVTAFRNNWQVKVGELHPKDDDTSGSSTPLRTKLSGDITPTDLKTGDELNLIYPRTPWEYTGQDGKWETISTKYDYATTNVTVVYIDASSSNSVYATTALFGQAQQAIARFTLLDSQGTAFQTSELTITTAGNQLVQKCGLNGVATEKGGSLVIKSAEPTNVFYVAIRNDNPDADQYTLTAKNSEGKVYTYTRSDVTLGKGTFKKYKVKMKFYDDTYTERDAYVDQGEEVWE